MTLLTRWEPLREFSTMQDRMNRMNRLLRESYSPEGPEEALTTTSFAPGSRVSVRSDFTSAADVTTSF